MQRKFGFSLVMAGVGALAAFAGEGKQPDSAPTQMPDMVISANRYETPAGKVGSSVTVLNAQDIQLSQQATVLEVLRTVPGIDIAQSGGPGRIADISLRGASSSQTLVLVDGVRVNAATLGAYDFANLSADNIERIEVLRGPQSTLYGSEAMGGVISITTRRGAQGHGGSARVEGGSPEQWRGGVEVHGGNAHADYSAAVDLQRYDGLSAADKSVGATEKDRFDNANASARIGGAILDDGRADLALRHFESTIDLDGFDGMVPADDLNASSDRDGTSANLTVRKPLASWWQQTIAGGIYDESLVGHDPDTVYNVYTINNRNVDASLQSDLLPSDAHVVSVGYEFEDRHGETKGSYSKDVQLNSVFAQEQWHATDALNLTGGARLDDHSEFGTEDTYRGTASYLLGQTGMRAHGSAGTGFKAPTLADLFYPNFGNPDLSPETSVGYDAGLEVPLCERASVDVTYFRNAFNDLISYDSTTLRAENIDEATAQGVEVAGLVEICTNLQLQATYTFMDSEDKGTGKKLARRPEHRATVEARYQPTTRLSTTATLVAVNDRIDSDGSPMDNYERIDLGVEYAYNRHVYPYARIENLLDQDYEEVNGFSNPGFTGVGGVRAEW